jgi:hypothetical protein
MSAVIETPSRIEPISVPMISRPVVLSIDEAVIKHRSQTYWKWLRTFEQDPAAVPLQHPDCVVAELVAARAKSRLKPAIICEQESRDQNHMGILIPKLIRSSQVGSVGPEWTLQGLRLASSHILGRFPSLEQQKRILKCAAEYATESNADFLLIEDLDASTALFHAAQDLDAHGCLLFQTKVFQKRHFINFPATENEYWSTFSSHCRKLFRRALKKSANAQLERITEIHQIPDFLHAAHEISKQSWQSQQLGLRIRNDEMELRQMTALAMHGMLRCYLYRIDGQPAAFGVGNQSAGCFFYEETGFKPEFRHFSPGRTMLLQILTDLFTYNPPRSFDFGFGDADYKQQFSNRQSTSGTVWLVPPTLRARVSLSHLNVCRKLRSAVFTQIRQSSLGIKARQWFRSLGTSSVTKTVAAEERDSDETADI